MTKSLKNHALRFCAIFLLALFSVSSLSMEASAIPANIEIYAVGDGQYIGLNKLTGVLEHATESMPENLVIPASINGYPVTSIADRLFQGRNGSENDPNDNGIVSVTVPSSVRSIGDQAFASCTLLKSVRVEEGATSLGKNAFEYCYSLENVSLPSTLTSIEDYTFSTCLALRAITIPSGVSRIGSHAFFKCKNLVSVTMPDRITTIGDYTFSECTSLQSITLPASLSNISTALFNGCTALNHVEVSGSVESVGKSAFGNCITLEKLILPEGVERISEHAFDNCRSLKILSLPKTINSISTDSFYGCDNVTFYVINGSYAQVFASANRIPFVSGTLDPSPDYPETPFLDVKDHWAKSSIEWAYAKGYFKGTSPTKFSPDSPVNRGMLVTVLYRMEGSPTVGTSNFTDVKANDYFASAVAWAQRTGVVNGMGNNTFKPYNNITREQLATMLYRYARYKQMNTSAQGNLSKFKDVSDISDYAGSAISWAVGSGIINGITSVKLSPKGTATRAQSAVMLQKFESLR